MDAKTREILEKVERGELTPTEAAELLSRQGGNEAQQVDQTLLNAPELPAGEPQSFGSAAPSPAEPAGQAEVVEDFEAFKEKWKSWWVYPLWGGALVFVLGAIGLAWANYSNRFFWAFCSAFPLLLGLGVMLLSFWSRQARWLHVRVKNDRPEHHERVAISMPLPTRLIGWIFKTFGRSIPGLREQPEVIDSMPDLMAALGKDGDPLIVEVNEKDGNEVRVYIM